MSPTAKPKTKTIRSREAKAFGSVLQGLRAAQGLSQEELAFRSDTNRTYVSDLERGIKEPCLAMLFRIAEALETSPSLMLQPVEFALRRRK